MAIERDLERINPIRKERDWSRRSYSDSGSRYLLLDLDLVVVQKIRKSKGRCSSVDVVEAIVTACSISTIAILWR